MVSILSFFLTIPLLNLRHQMKFFLEELWDLMAFTPFLNLNIHVGSPPTLSKIPQSYTTTSIVDNSKSFVNPIS